MMRKVAGVVVAIMATAGTVWSPAAVAHEMDGDQAAMEVELDPRDIVGDAALSLQEAIGAALAARPGRAVEADLEAEVSAEGADFFYEIMVVTDDGNLHEVKIDPRTGDVLADDQETDPEEIEELAEFQRALRYGDRTLAELVASAETVVKGTAMAAALGMEDGGPEADVLFASGRYLIEVGVEARAGQIIEIELEDLGESDDREDE